MDSKKLIIESKKFEIVQEIENGWEREIEEEEKIYQEIDEWVYDEKIYSGVEVVKEIAREESSLEHKPPFPSNKQHSDASFILGIELTNSCFIREDAPTSFFWFREKVQKAFLERVEQARDLLKQLEKGTVRIVDKFWGTETETTRETKDDLIDGLKLYIEDYNQGEAVLATFKE